MDKEDGDLDGPDKIAIAHATKARKKEMKTKLAAERGFLISQNKQKWFDRLKVESELEEEYYFTPSCEDDKNENESTEDACAGEKSPPSFGKYILDQLLSPFIERVQYAVFCLMVSREPRIHASSSTFRVSVTAKPMGQIS
jgi:hypothetical protein